VRPDPRPNSRDIERVRGLSSMTQIGPAKRKAQGPFILKKVVVGVGGLRLALGCAVQ
jgi:hypothetical protein